MFSRLARRRLAALDWLGAAWERLGRGAAEPAATGTAVGERRGGHRPGRNGGWIPSPHYRPVGDRPLPQMRAARVDEPRIIELLEELRCAMGCRQPVSLREVVDLTTPATAGRRRPVLLLPDDWRTWSAAELRAVLAHELAHIVRGDYTTGLLARLAVVLNCYHPLVRYMADRLQLQQEQAADAMGALFAGGRDRYLVALSSLALRQDGRSPRWPARAFLPPRRTLIRRIAMLRDESASMSFSRPLSRALRLLIVFGMVGLTIGVAALRGPALGADDGPSRVSKTEVTQPQPRDPSNSFVAPYVPDANDGVLAVRPAAAFRHKGMDRLLPLLQPKLLGELLGVDLDFSVIAKELKVDTARPGFLTFRCQDIEWFTVGIRFDQSPPKGQTGTQGSPSSARDAPMHRIIFGTPAVRMVAPFDWLAFLRQWRCGCEEVRASGHAYYRITGKPRELLGGNMCVFVPDDRTIVLGEEELIRRIAAGDDGAPPAYVRNKEWERASRGLVAIAISNRNDKFTKHYDLGRPDDALMLPLFKGLDTWIFGVEDADPIVLQADAACRNREASEAIGRSLDSLIKLGRQSIEQNAPKSPDAGAQNQIARILKALAANVRVEHTDTGISARAQDFGTLADFAMIVGGEAQEASARVATGNDAKELGEAVVMNR